MKQINIVKYQCDYCKKRFNTKSECKLHQRMNHKCPICDHSYYVYGVELECELKGCHFKPKTNKTIKKGDK